jgi:hypothetical protein
MSNGARIFVATLIPTGEAAGAAADAVLFALPAGGAA